MKTEGGSVDGEALRKTSDLMGDLKKVRSYLSAELMPEKTVLLLGETKAGKTTLLYYLYQKQLRRVMNDEQVPVMEAEIKAYDAEIGNSYESTTVYPNIPVELTEDGALIIDLPGFSDTRSRYRLLNIFIINQTIKRIKNAHIVLVIPIETFLSSGLFGPLERSTMILSDAFIQTANSVSFVLTKVEESEAEDMVEQFKESLEDIAENEAEGKFQAVLNSIKNSNVYVFEDSEPEVQAGAELQRQIIRDNSFVKVNHRTEKVLSKQYAEVIAGENDREQLVRDALCHISVIESQLPLVLELFDQALSCYFELLTEGDETQKALGDLLSRIEVPQFRSVAGMRAGFEPEQVATILDLYLEKKPNSGARSWQDKIEEIVAWSHRFSESKQTSISKILRTCIYDFIAHSVDLLKVIPQINEPQLIETVKKVKGQSGAISSTVTKVHENFSNLTAKVAELPQAKQLLDDEQKAKVYSQALGELNPSILSAAQDVIIKVPTFTTIRNTHVKKELEESTKSRSRRETIKIPPMDEAAEIRKMAHAAKPCHEHLRSLQRQLGKIYGLDGTNDIADRTDDLRLLFRATIKVLEGLGLIEEAAVFALAVPDDSKAAQLIVSGIQFKILDAEGVDFFMSYFSSISPNFQMVEYLFNYKLTQGTSLSAMKDSELERLSSLVDPRTGMHTHISKQTLPNVELRQFDFRLIEGMISGMSGEELLSQAKKRYERYSSSVIDPETIQPLVTGP